MCVRSKSNKRGGFVRFYTFEKVYDDCVIWLSGYRAEILRARRSNDVKINCVRCFRNLLSIVGGLGGIRSLPRARKRKNCFVGLFFDGVEYVLDKEDLTAIDDILKTVSEGMDDLEGVVFPLLYREIVMNRVGK